MAIIFLICSFFSLLPLSQSVDFTIDSFRVDTTNILYLGDAVPNVGTIEFNKVNYINRVGQAIYYASVPIWDRKTGKLTDFTTHFTFTIDTQGRSPYGNGFTFFLAPLSFQIPPNSAGGFLGLFNTTYTDSPGNQMLVIEFDSFVNPEWDPPFEHVGINKNSIRSANYTAWDASLNSGNSTDAWVSYNSTTQVLNLRWNYGAETDAPANMNTSLSYQVDLREVLPERVMVGFSAATGANVERHYLQFWKFSSSLNMVDNDGDHSNKKWILYVLIIGVTLVAITACVFWRKRSAEAVPPNPIDRNPKPEATPKKFSYKDLVEATDDFSNDKKLGEGESGCVHKGYLTHEKRDVAVKKILKGSKQGKIDYIAEVKTISKLRHRNLVRLIGWCDDETQLLLVYEFMPNGNLNSHLFGKKSTLGWTMRYKIAMDLADALLYLHESRKQSVVHRGIKTSNIMFDSGFNVKLGGFGLARLEDHESSLKTSNLGYLAPECVVTGIESKESDVYSFGVVALEIATGRNALDSVDLESDLGLVKWVWGLLEKKELLSGVDQKLNGDYDSKQVERLMMVGLWCAHPDWSERPSIKEVIKVLKFDGLAPDLPLKMPMPSYRIKPDGSEVGSGSSLIRWLLKFYKYCYNKMVER